MIPRGVYLNKTDACIVIDASPERVEFIPYSSLALDRLALADFLHEWTDWVPGCPRIVAAEMWERRAASRVSQRDLETLKTQVKLFLS